MRVYYLTWMVWSAALRSFDATLRMYASNKFTTSESSKLLKNFQLLIIVSKSLHDCDLTWEVTYICSKHTYKVHIHAKLLFKLELSIYTCIYTYIHTKDDLVSPIYKVSHNISILANGSLCRDRVMWENQANSRARKSRQNIFCMMAWHPYSIVLVSKTAKTNLRKSYFKIIPEISKIATRRPKSIKFAATLVWKSVRCNPTIMQPVASSTMHFKTSTSLLNVINVHARMCERTNT